jgi:hypothetical protein
MVVSASHEEILWNDRWQAQPGETDLVLVDDGVRSRRR